MGTFWVNLGRIGSILGPFWENWHSRNCINTIVLYDFSYWHVFYRIERPTSHDRMTHPWVIPLRRSLLFLAGTFTITFDKKTVAS